MTQVGIDDLNIYAGPLYVSFGDIATARGFKHRDLVATGFHSRSVVPPWEDAVTFGVNAAAPLVRSHGADAFQLLLVATESGLDYERALGTQIHAALRLSPRCRTVELKQACYAGTAALQLAADWVRAGCGRVSQIDGASERKALIVMTDVARMRFGERIELAAGCGAVAMVISASPRVVELGDSDVSGFVTRDVFDMARPTATTELGHPTLSLLAYLDLFEAARESYARAAGTSAEPHADYLLYHTPLLSLVRKAHQLVSIQDDDFAKRVEPGFRLSRLLGNTFTASLYVALAGLVTEVNCPAPVRVGLYSYGSGACAEYFTAMLLPSARAVLQPYGLDEHLAARRQIDVATYERIEQIHHHAAIDDDYTPDLSECLPLYESAYANTSRLVLVAKSRHHRTYRWSLTCP